MAMLFQRVGGITADMMFDPASETVVKYDALSLRHGFLLRADAYRVVPLENGVSLYSAYRLNDGSGQPEIMGIQEMTVQYQEDADLEESV